jgi:hypothetical protein
MQRTLNSETEDVKLQAIGSMEKRNDEFTASSKKEVRLDDATPSLSDQKKEGINSLKTQEHSKTPSLVKVNILPRVFCCVQSWFVCPSLCLHL